MVMTAAQTLAVNEKHKNDAYTMSQSDPAHVIALAALINELQWKITEGGGDPNQFYPNPMTMPLNIFAPLIQVPLVSPFKAMTIIINLPTITVV
jgi:hypothetical protein